METEAVHGKRILLVENERVERELIKELLRSDKHIVTEANNGAEAFTLFTQHQFDLVMTDCVMPFVGGDELAVRIKRMAPTQPILMITGNNYKRGPKNPVDAIVAKPFEYPVLQKEMSKLLHN